MADRYDTATGFHILDKTPAENILFDINLSKRMRAGDTIASVSSVVATSRDLVTGSELPTVGDGAFSGTTAQSRISGGTAGEEYVIVFTVSTTAGDTVTGSGILQVI